MPRSCPCGGVCKGNAARCAFNVRMQERAERPRPDLRLVPEERDPVVFLRVRFDDDSTCLLTAEQFCGLSSDYIDAIVASEFVSVERTPLLVQP